MRIKKTVQTTPLTARVIDGASTSTTNTYSARYINELIASASQTSYNARRYDTISDMNSHIVVDGVIQGDYAVVYQPYSSETTTGDVVSGQSYSAIIFPQEVVFDTAVSTSSNAWVNFGGYVGTGNVVISPTGFSLQIYNPSFNISYTSSDGLTYTTSASTLVLTIPSPNTITIPSAGSGGYAWTADMNHFMTYTTTVTTPATFNGVFIYNGSTYDLVDTQLDATSYDVLDGVTFYGSSGVEVGQLVPGGGGGGGFHVDVHMTGMKCANNTETLGLENLFDITNIDEYDLARGIFQDCTSLQEFSPIEQSVISEVLNPQHMPSSRLSDFCKGLFKGCSMLNDSSIENMTIYFGNTAGGELGFDLSYMFCDCNSLTYFPTFAQLTASRVTNISYMLANCSGLDWSTDNSTNHLYYFISSISGLHNTTLLDWHNFCLGLDYTMMPLSTGMAEVILYLFQGIQPNQYYGSQRKCTLQYLGITNANVRSTFTQTSIWNNLLYPNGWRETY